MTQRGLTLLELAVVIAIFGVILGTTLPIFQQINKAERRAQTQEKMVRIIDALAVYAQQNYAVPCPADPAPIAMGGGEPLGTASPGCGVFFTPEGVVPFRDLGLTQEDVIDGWGHYFTYRVSPAFTHNVSSIVGGGISSLADAAADEIANPEPFVVHEACRTDDAAVTPQVVPDWINAGNKNSAKAIFCCPNALSQRAFLDWPNVSFEPGDLSLLPGAHPGGTDLVVVDTDLNPLSGTGETRSTTAAYADRNAAAAGFPADINTETIAFVLISHGANKTGAFLVNGTRDRFGVGDDGVVTTSSGCCEIENFDTDFSDGDLFTNSSGNAQCNDMPDVIHDNVGRMGEVVFCTAPYSANVGESRFDDIIMWRTQDQLLAELGQGSCLNPY